MYKTTSQISSMRYLITVLFFSSIQMIYGQAQLDSVSHIDYQQLHSANLNDVWGYVDEAGNEYAIVGTTKGVSIVDVSDPVNPQEIFWLGGIQSIWRDPKVFGDYAYITTEANEGMTIIDLSPLPSSTSLTSTIFMGQGGVTWDSAHNCFVDELGYLYVFGANYGEGGVLIYDVNSTPMNPPEVGIFDDWYVHDGYARNDTLYLAHVFDGFMSLVDVSDKANPLLLGTKITADSFTHNIWPSDDGQVVYTTDELPDAYVVSYDITDPNNIVELDRIQSSPGSDVIPHNTFVVNDYLVTSYYVDGVTIHDTKYPYNLIEVAAYDTYPGQTPTYDGCWGVYPYLPSGLILASDMTGGLFLLQPDYQPAAYLEGIVTNQVTAETLPNVSVQIVTSNDSEITNTNGFYATGMSMAATYEVIYSKVGFFPQTVFVTLSQGVITNQDIQLVPITPYLLMVEVMDSQGNPIQDAQIKLVHPLIVHEGQSNGVGEEAFYLYYNDTYEVFVGKWEYITQCTTESISPSTGTLTITLPDGYYDDFEFDFGWTVTGDAETGEWDRGVPNPTTNVVMGNDAAGDCGTMAYVTGNRVNVDPDYDDVDNGMTILRSPSMDLTTYSNPAIIYNYAFYCNHGPFNIDDTLSLLLNNGTNFAIIWEALPPQGDPMAFSEVVITDLDQYVAITNSMTISIFTSDFVPHINITEAAFDFFRIEDYIGLTENDSEGYNLYPNPTNEYVEITGAGIGSQFTIHSFNGKSVNKGVIESENQRVNLSFLSPGVYFISINGKQEKIVKL